MQISAPQYQGQASDYPYYLHLYVSDLLSDGRGASQPWLQGSPDPMTTVSWQTLVEINPDTAQKLGLADGDVVKSHFAKWRDTGAHLYFPGYPARYGCHSQRTGPYRLRSLCPKQWRQPIQLLGNQAELSGNNLTWSNLRVKLTPTGQKVSLALFEYKLGVTQGFINAAFPGQ